MQLVSNLKFQPNTILPNRYIHLQPYEKEDQLFILGKKEKFHRLAKQTDKILTSKEEEVESKMIGKKQRMRFLSSLKTDAAAAAAAAAALLLLLMVLLLLLHCCCCCFCYSSCTAASK